MFNLENAISQWRYASGTREDISQRETQLRESLASLQQQGLNEEEAFMLASHRIGRPTSKTIEYETESPVVTSWRDRLYWMIAGGLAMTAGTAIVSMVANACIHVLGILDLHSISGLFAPGTTGICTAIVAHGIALVILYNAWFYARRGLNFGSVPALSLIVAFITLGPLLWQPMAWSASQSQNASLWTDWIWAYGNTTWIISVVMTVAMGVGLWMLRKQRSSTAG